MAFKTQEIVLFSKTEKEKIKNDIIEEFNGASATPIASLSVLQSTYPNGANGIYVALDSGLWYGWNGSSWVSGGTYQSQAIGEKSIEYSMFSEDTKNMIRSALLTRETRLDEYLATNTWADYFTDSTVAVTVNGKTKYKNTLKDVLAVGDQLTYKWKDYKNGDTFDEYDAINNVVHFEDDTEFKDEEGTYTRPSTIVEWDYTIPFTIEYSPAQAWLTLTNGLPAGTYCIYVNGIKTYDGWENVRALYEGKYLSFTLTKPIPSGGQLRGKNVGTNASTPWGVKTTSAWDNHSVIEEMDFSVSNTIVGIYLGKSWGDIGTNGIIESVTIGGVVYPIGRINHFERVAAGSNRYKHSVVRRWLNSDAPNGEWYTKCEDDPYEVKSTRSELLNRSGFMRGLPDVIKTRLKPNKIQIHVAGIDTTIADDHTDSTRAIDIMYDKVFILTATERCCNTENTTLDEELEGKPYDWYKALCEQVDTERVSRVNGHKSFKLWATYKILKRFAINAKTSSQNYWNSDNRLSSGCNAWNVYHYGLVSYVSAYGTGVRCLPACKIGGNRA